MTNHPHVLYRFYAAGGELLYIGITAHPLRRFRSHQTGKSWWQQVDRISVENHATARFETWARRDEWLS